MQGIYFIKRGSYLAIIFLHKKNQQGMVLLSPLSEDAIYTYIFFKGITQIQQSSEVQ